MTKASNPTSSKRYTSFDKVKTDDIILLRYYVKVKSKDMIKGVPQITVKDLDKPITMHVNGFEVIEASLSADQFESEKYENQTQLIERFIQARNVPFTVCFEKKDKSKRILRGRFITQKPDGRCQVFDLDIEQGNPLRLVDTRTIEWLILENVKYIVKGK